jgi:hypothetical protein
MRHSTTNQSNAHVRLLWRSFLKAGLSFPSHRVVTGRAWPRQTSAVRPTRGALEPPAIHGDTSALTLSPGQRFSGSCRGGGNFHPNAIIRRVLPSQAHPYRERRPHAIFSENHRQVPVRLRSHACTILHRPSPAIPAASRRTVTLPVLALDVCPTGSRPPRNRRHNRRAGTRLPRRGACPAPAAFLTSESQQAQLDR